MLFIFIRMEPDDVRDLAIAKALDALSGLRVPELHLPIVSAGQEFATVVRESNVLDGLHVTMKGTETIAVGVDVPQLPGLYESVNFKVYYEKTDLDLGVHRPAEE